LALDKLWQRRRMMPVSAMVLAALKSENSSWM
jgi:hypothetical protein